jgi:hypothetical protein
MHLATTVLHATEPPLSDGLVLPILMITARHVDRYLVVS